MKEILEFTKEYIMQESIYGTNLPNHWASFILEGYIFYGLQVVIVAVLAISVPTSFYCSIFKIWLIDKERSWTNMAIPFLIIIVGAKTFSSLL